MKARRNYDSEFKQTAVVLSHHWDDIGKLAEELEIKPEILYRWRREAKKAKEGAFPGHGNPKMTEEQKEINSGQGSQYTSIAWIHYLEEQGIQISMDSKGRAIDNIWIDRFWKSIKYNYIFFESL